MQTNYKFSYQFGAFEMPVGNASGSEVHRTQLQFSRLATELKRDNTRDQNKSLRGDAGI
jgi:hypothetical protein